MQNKSVLTSFMVNEHPIICDARNVALSFPGKISGERMVFEQFRRRNVNGELIDDLNERS